MTTHEIISAKEAPTPDPSTPGEVERLADALIEASQAAIWHRFGPQPAASMPGAASAIDAARTALLSHITAARSEGAGELARLSDLATAGLLTARWSIPEEGADCIWIVNGAGQILGEFYGPQSSRFRVANAELLVALWNDYRSGRLVERSAATNPQDQE